VAHTHADELTVFFDDGREPKRFTDATYTLWRDGLTVFKDGEAIDFPLARAVAGKAAVPAA
jgi:hypothetical protein